MISKMQVMESFVGKPVADSLVQTLYNQCEGFPKVYQDYLDAIEKLYDLLGSEAKRDIRRYIAAIELMCASNLYYLRYAGPQDEL